MTPQNPTEPNTLAALAVTTLHRLLTAETAPPALRLRAAQAILRAATRPAARSSATRDIDRFDQLCIDLAPHQALTRLARELDQPPLRAEE